MFEIRPAGPADLPAIVTMRDDLNAHELAGCPHASIQKLSLEEFTALWGPTFGDPDYCWRIVEEERRPIGFGLLYLIKPPTRPPGGFLHWAYLDSTHRRRGLGRALLENLFAWARSRRLCRVELQFIEGNEQARLFWTRMGFRPYARKCVRDL
jgi:GNAT superfamily N-acetyltransferase